MAECAVRFLVPRNFVLRGRLIVVILGIIGCFALLASLVVLNSCSREIRQKESILRQVMRSTLVQGGNLAKMMSTLKCVVRVVGAWVSN